MTSSKPFWLELNAALDTSRKPRTIFTGKAEPAPGHVSARVRLFQERERLASELAPRAIKRPTVELQPVPQAPPPTAVNQSPDLPTPYTAEAAKRQPALSPSPIPPLLSTPILSETGSDQRNLNVVQTRSGNSPSDLASPKLSPATAAQIISRDWEEIPPCSLASSATGGIRVDSPTESEAAEDPRIKSQRVIGENSPENKKVRKDQLQNSERAPNNRQSLTAGDQCHSLGGSRLEGADVNESEQRCHLPVATLEFQAQLLHQSTQPVIPGSTLLCIEDDHLTQTLSFNPKSQDTSHRIPSLTEATKHENFEPVFEGRKSNSNEASQRCSLTTIDSVISRAEKEETITRAESTPVSEQVCKVFSPITSANPFSTGSASTTQPDRTSTDLRQQEVDPPYSKSEGRKIEDSSATTGPVRRSFGRRNTKQFHAPAFAQTNHAHEHTGRVVPPKPLYAWNKVDPAGGRKSSSSEQIPLLFAKPTTMSSENIRSMQTSQQKHACYQHRNRQSNTAFVSSKAHKNSQDEKSPWAIFERLQRKIESEAVAGTGRSIRLRAPRADNSLECQDCIKALAGEQAAAVASDTAPLSTSSSVRPPSGRNDSLPFPIRESIVPTSYEDFKTSSLAREIVCCSKIAESLYEDDTSVLSMLREPFELASVSAVLHSQTDGTFPTGSTTPDLVSISQTLDAIISSHRRALDEVTQSLSLELGLLTGEVEGRI